MTTPPIDSAAILAARLAGAGVVKRTPITESLTLSERFGGNVVLKAENLQDGGEARTTDAAALLEAAEAQLCSLLTCATQQPAQAMR